MSSRQGQDDDLVGDTVAGRYWIISRLGAGAMGVAYRAWDEQQGRPVVIKVPKRNRFEDDGFAERFSREIRLLQGLVHPHVVPIIDVGEHAGLPVVVMRFLPGGSLAQRRLRNDRGQPEPNPPGMLHLWLPAVAAAIDHVHEQGVVHRDIKPANIFFDAFWGAFVGDFGIAKIVGESDAFGEEEPLTRVSVGIGTPEYMAPELWTTGAVLDGSADQYALAVVVYEILAARRPFHGALPSLMAAILTQPPPELDRQVEGLPRSLTAAVHRALAKNPRHRFATCRDFAAQVLRDVPAMADDPGLARLLCPQCSRLLKLPLSAAGREGNCPNCRGRLVVAEDFAALWLLTEEHHADGDVEVEAQADAGSEDEFSGLPIPRGPARRHTPRRHGRKRAVVNPFVALVAILGILLLVVIMVLLQRESARPRTTGSRAAAQRGDPPEASGPRSHGDKGSNDAPSPANPMPSTDAPPGAGEAPAPGRDAIDVATVGEADMPSAPPDPVVGRWKWRVDGKVIGFREVGPDGVIAGYENSSWYPMETDGPPNGVYFFHWRLGEAGEHVDRLTIDPNGRKLHGNNATGQVITAEKVD